MNGWVRGSICSGMCVSVSMLCSTLRCYVLIALRRALGSAMP